MEPSTTLNLPLTIESTSSSELKYCKHPDCKKPLVQGESEHSFKFKIREHCDLTCSRTNPLIHQALVDKATAKREQEPRVCVVCNGSFVRHRVESKKVFAARQTCGRVCEGAKRRAEADKERAKYPKICSNEECGKSFYRRRGETTTRFEIRAHCNPKCAVATRKKRNADSWVRKPRRKSPYSNKKLSPLSEPPIPIPKAPRPESEVVWRPGAWGGEYVRRLG
jgi:hypothetical protein